jgi:type IV pilus assembly protein PilO
MTAGDFIPDDSGFESAPAYQTIFGIPMSPLVLGILFGLLGLGAAAYLLFNFVQPAWQETQDLQAKVQEQENQLKQQDQIKKQVKDAKEQLVKVNKQKEQVLALFAKPKDLDTLLLDVNKLIDRNNAELVASTKAKLNNCPAWVQNQYNDVISYEKFKTQLGDLVTEAKLNKFNPDSKTGAQLVTDGSLGPVINNKLRRQTINVEFQGNFNQTQSIFRTIERLQPLLLIKKLDVKVGDGGSSAQTKSLYEVSPDNGQIRFLTNCQPDAKITTAFQMDALMPLSAEESKAAATAAAAPPPPPPK